MAPGRIAGLAVSPMHQFTVLEAMGQGVVLKY